MASFSCVICLDECTEPVSTPCGHNFHKQCLTTWIRQSQAANRTPSCPLCSRAIDTRPENLHVNRELERAIAALRRRATPSDDDTSSYTLAFADITVGDVIGAGGNSTVYMGTWQGAPAALKIPQLLSTAGSSEIQRFLREIHLLSKLRHPNIVSLYGMARRPDGAVLIVSKLGKLSLWDVLRASGTPALLPAPAPAVLRLALGIARAIAYLHARTPAVIHCDIKSPNVILDDAGEPMLADFGVSRELSTAAATLTSRGGGVRGTSAWCAPENFDADDPQHGKPPSDVYSLGVVMNEMLTGARPFDGRNDLQIMTAVLANSSGRCLRATRPSRPACSP